MSENWANLDGGRFLASLYNTDSIQAAFLQKIINSINKLGTTLGANPVGKVQPPPPIDNVNISTSGEMMQVALNHNKPVKSGINYFVEVDSNPNFTNPQVKHLGPSRSPGPFTLPTFDSNGKHIPYYVRAYSQYPGSNPSPPTVFGGPLNPAKITMGGSTQMSLLSSTGSGTSSPTGQQGAKGFGTTPVTQAAIGPVQASIGPSTAQAPTSGTSVLGSLVMPSIFSVSGASPVTGSPQGGAIDVALIVQNANLVFAGPGSGSPATPTFRALVLNDEVAAGSSGQIQFSNGTTFAADSDLTWDNSGKVLNVTQEISITHTNALSTLSIGSAFPGSALILMNGFPSSLQWGNGQELLDDGSAGLTMEVVNSGSVLTFQTNSGVIQFKPNGSVQFSIASNGGVLAASPTGGSQGSGTINVAGNYYINGVFIGKKISFTPTLVGFTVVGGTGATTQGQYTQVGNLIFFNIIIFTNGGTVAGTGGGTSKLTGLPVSADAFSNYPCIFGDNTVNDSYPYGLVSGTTVFAPTFGAQAANILINGSYFA